MASTTACPNSLSGSRRSEGSSPLKHWRMGSSITERNLGTLLKRSAPKMRHNCSSASLAPRLVILAFLTSRSYFATSGRSWMSSSFWRERMPASLSAFGWNSGVSPVSMQQNLTKLPTTFSTTLLRCVATSWATSPAIPAADLCCKSGFSSSLTPSMMPLIVICGFLGTSRNATSAFAAAERMRKSATLFASCAMVTADSASSLAVLRVSAADILCTVESDFFSFSKSVVTIFSASAREKAFLPASGSP